MENGRKKAKNSMVGAVFLHILVVCKICLKKGYQIYYWYVIINEPGMEGGVLISKQIHLDERLATCT